MSKYVRGLVQFVLFMVAVFLIVAVPVGVASIWVGPPFGQWGGVIALVAMFTAVMGSLVALGAAFMWAAERILGPGL